MSTDFGTRRINRVTEQQRLIGGWNVETLAGTKVLATSSSHFQILDPGGASRDITLLGDNEGKGGWFFFRNTADAAENLVVKDAADVTIATVGQGQCALVFNALGLGWALAIQFAYAGTLADAIDEITGAHGVIIDSLRIKDGAIDPVAGGTKFINLANIATGEGDIVLKDNLASALEILEAANSYLRFCTTNGSEALVRGKPMTVGAAVDLIADPGDAGAIPVTRSGNCAMTSAGAETRTLAIPTFIDQELTLTSDVYVGDIVVTVAQAINKAGNTIITFNSAGESIFLRAAQIGGALRWRVVAADVAALS